MKAMLAACAAAMLVSACVSAAQQSAIDELSAPRPAPSSAALASAPILPAGQAEMTTRPNVRHYIAVYPRRALEHGIDGQVELECLVEDDLGIACAIGSETPGLYGFGDAALTLTSLVRVASELPDGRRAEGGKFYWDVAFYSNSQAQPEGEIALGASQTPFPPPALVARSPGQ